MYLLLQDFIHLCVWSLVAARKDSSVPTGESEDEPGKELSLFWFVYVPALALLCVIYTSVLCLFQSQVNWRMHPAIALQEYVLIPGLGIGCSVKHATYSITAYVRECLFRELKRRISVSTAVQPLLLEPLQAFH